MCGLWRSRVSEGKVKAKRRRGANWARQRARLHLGDSVFAIVWCESFSEALLRHQEVFLGSGLGLQVGNHDPNRNLRYVKYGVDLW